MTGPNEAPSTAPAAMTTGRELLRKVAVGMAQGFVLGVVYSLTWWWLL